MGKELFGSRETILPISSLLVGFILALLFTWTLLMLRRMEGMADELVTSNRELDFLTKELERSNRDLHDFTSIAAHDLKAPIRQIKSFSELLQRHHREKLIGDGQEFLDFIKRSVEDMERLITSLLELSRVGGSNRPL